MLLPTLSVTLVGVVVALVTGDRGRPVAAVSWGVAGAWAGFLVGAIVGVLMDVIGGTGQGVLIVGHVAAVAGAVVGAKRGPGGGADVPSSRDG